jgi:hypothetical protein
VESADGMSVATSQVTVRVFQVSVFLQRLLKKLYAGSYSKSYENTFSKEKSLARTYLYNCIFYLTLTGIDNFQKHSLQGICNCNFASTEREFCIDI